MNMGSDIRNNKNRGKLICWEFFTCRNKECPAYKSENFKCWLVPGTHCRDEIQDKFLEKIDICIDCEVFKENMNADTLGETFQIVNKQLKQSRKAGKKLEEKIIEYEKLSALGRLTANVAHEIRNPITVIGGLVERLKKSFSHDAKENEYLEMISAEARRLEEVLKDVLVFSDKAVFKREMQDINKIVDDTLNAYENRFKNASIDVNKFLNGVPRIYIDDRHIRVAIGNLLSNAIDAMPDGGSLTVATNVASLSRKTYVAVRISDTGVGIPEERIQLIYEPFFTTKKTKQVTGLGLPIARKIIEGHGGLIKVDSVVGKGSTFTLFFPFRST
jgi:signal transduction histidine kinase